MLGVANEPIMLSAILVNVVVLNIIVLNVILNYPKWHLR